MRIANLVNSETCLKQATYWVVYLCEYLVFQLNIHIPTRFLKNDTRVPSRLMVIFILVYSVLDEWNRLSSVLNMGISSPGNWKHVDCNFIFLLL